MRPFNCTDVFEIYHYFSAWLLKQFDPDDVALVGEEIPFKAILVNLERHLVDEMVLEWKVLIKMVNPLDAA